MAILIADCGATKGEWCLISGNNRKKIIFTQGISPYFLNEGQMVEIFREELLPQLGKSAIEEIAYYGTGCLDPVNASVVKKALKAVFSGAKINVTHDLMAASHALCGDQKGVTCILGTGSNSGYYDGKKIVKNSPGLGYVLGDEGSGAYLGKKVIQYFLYNTYDEDLNYKFLLKFNTDKAEILDNVYKKPLPNRYLAGFTLFLAENRGHFMVENIIEDGLNDFFFQHLCKYSESWKYPIHFVGSVAFGFKDKLLELCHNYEFEPGNIIKQPMDGLVQYYLNR